MGSHLVPKGHASRNLSSSAGVGIELQTMLEKCPEWATQRFTLRALSSSPPPPDPTHLQSTLGIMRESEHLGRFTGNAMQEDSEEVHTE